MRILLSTKPEGKGDEDQSDNATVPQHEFLEHLEELNQSLASDKMANREEMEGWLEKFKAIEKKIHKIIEQRTSQKDEGLRKLLQEALRRIGIIKDDIKKERMTRNQTKLHKGVENEFQRNMEFLLYVFKEAILMRIIMT